MSNETQTNRPRRLTEPELKKVGVRQIDRIEVRLECQDCGRQWSPNLGRHGRMPRDFWNCPGGCNSSE